MDSRRTSELRFQPVPVSAAWANCTSQFTSLYSTHGHGAMDLLSMRLQTFILWPGWAPLSVHTSDLAAAGLYYTGEADVVRCYACCESFSGWKDGDVPADVHRRRSPSCSAVTALGSCRQDAPSSPPPSPPSPSYGAASLYLPDTGAFSSGRLETKSRATEDCVDVGTSSAACCGSQNSVTSTSRAAKHDKTKLERENCRLRSDFDCRQCKKNKVQTLFLPCRHLVTCQTCADAMDDCIKCGQKILGTVRVYMI